MTSDDASPSAAGVPVLRYTFGNHMHWVDMTWLWGESVMPGSVRDMLRLCREGGVRGNVNFDGVGYERLAADHPDAFAELADAVASGAVEVVGGSYGQPYGLFHGGESNVRQRVVGARTVQRLFGTPLRTFWEEEFDFFPQLPQMLAGVGVTHACLFFQWTWHTPHVPEHEAPAVWWTGQDGTRLLTSPPGPLDVHQWPEDLEPLLSGDLPRRLAAPAIVQWLELLPSPDWMCRSELLLPPLRRLLAREDVEVRPGTLREILDGAEPHAVTRTYGLAEVFHGVSLGKNGDHFRRLSRRAEARLQAAEALATIAGSLGRPYPRWDVYPTWELEEAWRELLAAQHHDNDECEGLCGHVGRLSYERSLGLSGGVIDTTLASLARRSDGPPVRLLVMNPLGWERDAVVEAPGVGRVIVRDLPPLGYRVVASDGASPWSDPTELVRSAGAISLERGALRAEVDAATGTLTQLWAPGHEDGALAAPIGQLSARRNGAEEPFERVEVDGGRDDAGACVRVRRRGREGHEVTMTVRLAPTLDAIDLEYSSAQLPRPDGGVAAALATRYRVRGAADAMAHDHPYGVSEIVPHGRHPRKYPSGDWMTSPQWFEWIERPFTAWSLLDLPRAGGGGLLLLHDGSQSFSRDEDGGVRQVLSLYDPWDEDYFDARLAVRCRLVPHRGLRHAERWRLAREFEIPPLTVPVGAPGGILPREHALVRLHAPAGAVVVALYREHEIAGAHVPGYAGTGMDYPIVLRLLELDGASGPAELEVLGTLARAARTDLLGRVLDELPVRRSGAASTVSVPLAPHRIETLYLDVVEARKVARDLDARRGVWARVHRDVEARPVGGVGAGSEEVGHGAPPP